MKGYNRQGRGLIPPEHGNEGFLELKVICFIDATGIGPCPLDPSVPYSLAEHLQLVMSEGVLEVIYHNVDDLVKPRFVVFPSVRKCGVAVVLHNLLLNKVVINVCGH